MGKAGAGKSSAAELLTSTLGYRRLSFATPLKEMALDLWGEGADTDRDKLQKLGVAVRQIEPDTWVNLALEAKRQWAYSYSYSQYPKPVVNDDLRFENEWWALQGAGFVIVRVEAPVELRIARLKENGKWQDEAQLEHESETAVDHLVAGYTVTNDGSRDEFNEQLIDIVIRERARR